MTFEQKLKHYRITESEYKRIQDLLGRPPQGLEWALFSALWSEHCSYKSSRVHLKKFAKTLTAQAQGGTQENAGCIDLGMGERIAFKMESHNHPSFIEPYQGAATGVGGILRDIFTMGARPIALGDYLCFGQMDSSRMGELVDGVVRGIGGYGNSVGVPTVTGQTYFHSSYDRNILVNALAVGYFGANDKIASSVASGVGNYIIYVGAKTGKDGVHGAAMASESFGTDIERKKPNVQIGDPFFEKLLIEACIEVIQNGWVVAIQDMGAAGLTSSSFEMSAKGSVGFKLDLDRIPLRDSSMTAEEILLSESQERMLLVCEPSRFASIQKCFEHWGLDAAIVGSTTADREVELWWKGKQEVKMDPRLIVDQSPEYTRPFEEWNFPRRQNIGLDSKSEGPAFSFDLSVIADRLKLKLGGLDKSSRLAVFKNYDQRVGGKTVLDCAHPNALIRLPESARGLSLAMGCRPWLMSVDAALGATDAVVLPALQMACQGAKAIGVTDCLNFGNPEQSKVMSEFVASVDAIVQASCVFEAPVVSGNVSFYNETLGKSILSTPATAVVGLSKTVEALPRSSFVGAKGGTRLILLGLPSAWSNGFWEQEEITKEGVPLGPRWFGDIDLAAWRHLQLALLGLAPAVSKGIQSLRVVGSGGLAMTLMQMAMESSLGFCVHRNLREQDILDVFYQIVLEVSSDVDLSHFASLSGVPFEDIGIVKGNELVWGERSWGSVFEWKKIWQEGLVKNVPNLS